MAPAGVTQPGPTDDNETVTGQSPSSANWNLQHEADTMILAQTATEIAGWIERVGWPAAMLILVGIAFYKVTKWAAPKIDRLLDNHIEYLDHQKESQTTNTEILGKLTSTAEDAHRNAASRLAVMDATADGTERLQTAGEHACDVLEHVCTKLELPADALDSCKKLRQSLARK